LSAEIQSLPGVNFFDGNLIIWRSYGFPETDEVKQLLYRLGLAYRSKKQVTNVLVAMKRMPKLVKTSTPIKLDVYLKHVREMGFWSTIHQEFLALLVNRNKKMAHKYPGYSCSIGSMTDYVHNLSPSLKGRDYVRNFQYYSRLEDTFRAIIIALNMSSIEVPNYFMRKLKKRLFKLGPDIMIQNIKEYADALRQAFFTSGFIPKPPSYLEGIKVKTHWKALKFSYIKRCLPSLLKKTESELFSEFFQRQSRPVVLDSWIKADFANWCKAWHTQYTKPELPRTLASFSNSACVERSRREGGQESLIKDIAEYQLFRNLCYPEGELERVCTQEMTKVQSITSNRLYEEVSPGITKLSINNAKVSLLCYYGSINLLRLITRKRGGPPIVPLYIKEKGGKSRIATMSSFCVIYLANIVRAMIQPSLDSDPRIRYSQRKENYSFPNWSDDSEYWFRSLDLKTATDNHNFHLTNIFYKEMLERLKEPPPFIREVIDLITGSYHMYKMDRRIKPPIGFSPIGGRNVNIFTLMYNLKPNLYKSAGIKFDMILDAEPTSTTWVDKDLSLYHFKGLPDKIAEFEDAYVTQMDHLEDYGMSQRGQFMGVATSWPLLPIYNLYCWERSSDQPLVDFGGYIAPKNAYLVCDTGDDLVGQCTPKHSFAFTEWLSLIGSEISHGKDFLSPDKFIYCELTIDRKNKNRYAPISSLAAPRGGVHTPNWNNIVQALRASELVLNRPLLPYISMTRFYYELCYAYKLGLPLDYPVALGGIDLPLKNPPLNSRGRIIRRLISKEVSNSNPGELMKLSDAKSIGFLMVDSIRSMEYIQKAGGEVKSTYVPLSKGIEDRVENTLPLKDFINHYRTPFICWAKYARTSLPPEKVGRIPIRERSLHLLKGKRLPAVNIPRVLKTRASSGPFKSMVRAEPVDLRHLQPWDVPLSAEEIRELYLDKTTRYISADLIRRHLPVSDMITFQNTWGYPTYRGDSSPIRSEWWEVRYYDDFLL